MKTLTLSKCERAALVRHLTVQRERLLLRDSDRSVLAAILIKVRSDSTVVLAQLEVFALMRHMRIQRWKLTDDMHALEERRRGGYDGILDAAWRRLDTDAMMLDDVLRRLWDMTS